MLEFSQNPDQPKPLKVTLEMYYKMAEMGILEPHKRYELFEGVIFELMPISPRHATKVKMKKMLLEVNRVPDNAEGRYREVKLLTLNESARFGGCEVAWWL